MVPVNLSGARPIHPASKSPQMWEHVPFVVVAQARLGRVGGADSSI